jgi:hypothetical protein
MTLGLSLQTFTILHVAISVLGLVSGFVVLAALLGNTSKPGWTAVFLVTTVLTTVSGFMFPITTLTPALVTGLISSPILAIALFAIYVKRLDGSWRWIYVVAAVGALYFNVVALIAQAFLKVPALKALAPTGGEPPFLIAQVIGLVIFLILGTLAVRRFRPYEHLVMT